MKDRSNIAWFVAGVLALACIGFTVVEGLRIHTAGSVGQPAIGKVLMATSADGDVAWTNQITLAIGGNGITLHTNGQTITVSNSLPESGAAGATNFWKPLFQTAGSAGAGGTETLLYSNRITGGTVSVDQSQLRVEAAFVKEGAFAATSRVRLYFGSVTAWNLIFDTGDPLLAASPDFFILCRIQKTSDGTQTAITQLVCDDITSSYTNRLTIDTSLGHSWSSDLVIFCTGVTTGGDSLTGRHWVGDVRPAFQ